MVASMPRPPSTPPNQAAAPLQGESRQALADGLLARPLFAAIRRPGHAGRPSRPASPQPATAGWHSDERPQPQRDLRRCRGWAVRRRPRRNRGWRLHRAVDRGRAGDAVRPRWPADAAADFRHAAAECHQRPSGCRVSRQGHFAVRASNRRHAVAAGSARLLRHCRPMRYARIASGDRAGRGCFSTPTPCSGGCPIIACLVSALGR